MAPSEEYKFAFTLTLSDLLYCNLNANAFLVIQQSRATPPVEGHLPHCACQSFSIPQSKTTQRDASVKQEPHAVC